MSTSSFGDRRQPSEAGESGSARAGRYPRAHTRPGLRIAARITVIAATLGLAGLSGMLATGSDASSVGQSRDAAPFDRVASR
jgi:hypothetical protein